MRRRITALVAATTSVVLLAFLVPTAYLVSRVARGNVENRAQAQLQALIPFVAVGDVPATRATLDTARTQGFYAWVTVPGSPTIGSDPADRALDAAGDTATVRQVDAHAGVPGGTVFTQPINRNGTTSVIRVLATDAQLTSGVLRIRVVLAGLGFVLFLLALLVADRLARSLARPITELAAAASRLESGELEARVAPAGPGEVREVGMALNRLARRIVELLAAERETVADISHRLRTPVTALRLDAGSLRDPEERARLGTGVDELDRAVDAVIRDARRPVADAMGSQCDAAQVVRVRLQFWSVLAREQDREVTVDVSESSLPVRVAEAELAAALDALLGNVFAHTPEGTAIRVSARPAPAGAVLTVSDDGPGLPAGDVLARGRSGAGSTGLGLSIVRRTAEAAGGSVTVGSAQSGGVEVTVVLGRPLV